MSTENVITDLIQTLEDGRKGFADASARLREDGNARLASTFETFAEQRARFSSELRSLASTKGLTIEEDGSIAGALHRGWIGLKDALTGDDTDSIVKAAVTGEEHALSEYDDAMSDSDLPVDVKTTISQQQATIRSTRDELNTLTS